MFVEGNAFFPIFFSSKAVQTGSAFPVLSWSSNFILSEQQNIRVFQMFWVLACFRSTVEIISHPYRLNHTMDPTQREPPAEAAVQKPMEAVQKAADQMKVPFTRSAVRRRNVWNVLAQLLALEPKERFLLCGTPQYFLLS